ncbi:MAG: hypothetical protein LBJ00_05360 [Planctomycetaceae bacterium]|nr:hypothetical protein [Planctomycetaceae bacterium]
MIFTQKYFHKTNFQFVVIYSSCFKIPEAEHASVASRSGCSETKPTAHTGYGITAACSHIGQGLRIFWMLKFVARVVGVLTSDILYLKM